MRTNHLRNSNNIVSNNARVCKQNDGVSGVKGRYITIRRNNAFLCHQKLFHCHYYAFLLSGSTHTAHTTIAFRSPLP